MMATSVESDNDLLKLLEDMGATPGQVAAVLTAAGVRGRREEADSCPIANWLRAETGADEALVDLEGIELKFMPLGPDGSPAGQAWYSACATTPPSVRLFIKRFDEGYFRLLDEFPDEPDDD